MTSRARSTSGFEPFRRELEEAWRSEVELVVLETVDSTNSEARRTIQAGGVRPTLFVAWGQEQGRGRCGRSWSSPPGAGIYASLIVPAPVALETLPLALPVAVSRGLEALGAGGIGVGWPNDILVGERKLAGLLMEAVSPGGRAAVAVLGIGVNYLTPDEAELGRPVIGLDQLVRPLPSLAEAAHGLLDPLVRDLLRPPATALIEVYRALSIHRPGERLTCRTATETVEGEFAGFDEQGFLRLVVDSAERRIAAGDVVER